jgi:hypothetical protein
VKISHSVIRFLFEAAFIIVVAAATAVAHLGKLWIAVSVGGAWLLVAVAERSAKQNHTALHNSRLAFLFPGRTEPVVQHGQGVEERPPMPEPDPDPEPAPAPEPAPPAPEPQPPLPEPVPPVPQLKAAPPTPPEPEPEPEPEPRSVVAHLPRADGRAREWNVWELERLARDQEGQDPARDEELTFLLLELRQFANADGQLPASFDALVRDSFGDRLYATA